MAQTGDKPKTFELVRILPRCPHCRSRDLRVDGSKKIKGTALAKQWAFCRGCGARGTIMVQ